MSLATVFVTIRPDTVGFGTRLSKSVNTESDKAGKAAGGRLKSGMARGSPAWVASWRVRSLLRRV
jgi:hypothetical protein